MPGKNGVSGPAGRRHPFGGDPAGGESPGRHDQHLYDRGFTKAAGIDFTLLETVLRQELRKEPELNLKVAKRGYDAADEVFRIRLLPQEVLPLITGNEAIALGLIKGGLDAYLAYPMTPTTPILHYLAGLSRELGLDTLHLENEISVILTALGYAYAGKKAAVGTSGGGFCLMTEGLSWPAWPNCPS